MNSGSFCPTFKIEFAQLSDLGMRRMNNQDSMAVVVTDDRATWSSRGHLLMVADGMGAHAAGELASKLAVDNIPHAYFKLRDLYPPAALRRAIRDANALIHGKGQSTIGFLGMGTTCSCLLLLPQGALVAHVGDSRVYRLRGHRLSQLTFDHSLVWEMAAAGQMAEEDVPAYIPKNVITRSLGPHETVNIDLEGPYDAAENDVFLLCSDGLSGQIPDAELGALLHCLTPEEAVQSLVDVANLRGGPDNISVVVARVIGEGAPPTKTVAEAPPRKVPSAPATSLFQAIGAASLVALVGCLVAQIWIGAAVAAAGLALSILQLATARHGRSPESSSRYEIGGPYGNGPYRDTPCEPDRNVVNRLVEIVDRLRQLTVGEGPQIDWSPLEKHASEGQAAAERGDFRSAIRGYTAAIRAVMRQLRAHRRTIDDSGEYLA